MGYFPERQVLTITRGTGELDIYGKATGIETLTLKARVIEGSHITTDRGSQAQGATIVCEVKIVKSGLADIRYEDSIEYINEAGTAYRGRPKNIKVQRDFAGKPVLTEVFI